MQTNLERQNDPAEPKTHYNIYKDILDLKKMFADYEQDTTEWGATNSGKVFYLQRCIDLCQEVNYGLLINLADTDETFPTLDAFASSDLQVVLSGTNSQYDKG